MQKSDFKEAFPRATGNPPFPMRLTIIVTALAGIFFLGCATTSPRTSENLQGDWLGVTAIIDGKSLSESTTQQLRLTITRDRYITTKGVETLFDSTYRLDKSTTPPRIFMLGNEGDLTGKEASGIYSLAPNSLTICYAMPGDPTPNAFTSLPGSKAYLITWRRLSK
jgi:uncharacterized protein (TIGR03067 family)